MNVRNKLYKNCRSIGDIRWLFLNFMKYLAHVFRNQSLIGTSKTNRSLSTGSSKEKIPEPESNFSHQGTYLAKLP